MTTINNIAVPASIADRGQYYYTPPEIVGFNGQGAAITAGYGRAVWRFSTMSADDYAWWRTTLLNGAASLVCGNNTTLVDDFQDDMTCTCVVMRPSYERIQNGLYINVEVRIERILET